MFRIGCHISAAGGYLAMGKRAEALGANTFAFFTRNPRGGASKALEEDDVAAFLAFAAQKDISALVAHAPYTLNPCAEKERCFYLTDYFRSMSNFVYTLCLSAKFGIAYRTINHFLI